MTRRPFLAMLSLFGLGAESATAASAAAGTGEAAPAVQPLKLSDADWKQRLDPQQYAVLRQEGTERAGTSPLNNEHRNGTFHCAGCELPLFSSETKFDSGTGWPSFYAPLAGGLLTKTDFKLILPRTEYHCARC